ncbi:MAG: four helix bundle protein [Bacteroidales bacterium]|nr:four helix bundle protein [Bacteroidales bacterium]MCF8457991.1 four helix bundle protein [Bacteroidales bacterium]
MKITKFEDIIAWQMARKLTQQAYSLTRKLEFGRDYVLCKQITGAAGSVMHNIVEGFDSESNVEFVRFLRYSKRSCTEVQSELYVALDQGYFSDSEFQKSYDQAAETSATIVGFIKYLLNSNRKK